MVEVELVPDVVFVVDPLNLGLVGLLDRSREAVEDGGEGAHCAHANVRYSGEAKMFRRFKGSGDSASHQRFVHGSESMSGNR